MSSPGPFPGLARDAPLAALVFAAMPAWLWSSDGKLLWCNAAAAALHGAESPEELVAAPPPSLRRAGQETAGLLPHLPARDAPQLARLRALAHTAFNRPPTCSCRRIRLREAGLSNGATGILATAIEPKIPVPSLSERARRTLAPAQHLAAFARNGALLHAGAAINAMLKGRASLDALVEARLVAEVLQTGSTIAKTQAGFLRLERFGDGDETVLVAHLETLREQAATPETLGADETPSQESTTNAAADKTGAAAPDQRIPAGSSEPKRACVFAPARLPTSRSSPSRSSPEANDQRSFLTVLNQMAERLVQRRHPLRFVWTMDADGSFTIEPGEFVNLMGEPTSSLQNRPWREVVQTLGIDADERVSGAIAARETWSGVVVEWPAEEIAASLPVALSGLPIMGSDRSFRGYRGFGICRDVSRIAALVAARRNKLTEQCTPASPPQLEAVSRPPPPAPDTSPADVFAPSPSEMRATLSLVPKSENVVPLRAAAAADRRPALNSLERSAFHEIARALGARVLGEEAVASATALQRDIPVPEPEALGNPSNPPEPHPPVKCADATPPHSSSLETSILERLPQAILAFRNRTILFANKALLDWTGAASIDALAAAGGVDALFVDPPAGSDSDDSDSDDGERPLSLRHLGGGVVPVDGRLFMLSLDGAPAAMMVLTRRETGTPQPTRGREPNADAKVGELGALLDMAADGVVMIAADGRILSASRRAASLFGYGDEEIVRTSFFDLLSSESRQVANDYLDHVRRNSVDHISDAEPRGREVVGRPRAGGSLHLFMILVRVPEHPSRVYAIFRDITRWKRTEEGLTNARRAAERASAAKSDFLAKVSHEIRTPLSAIVGFSELMLEERLGPIGNDRYRGYVRDIHASGSYIVSLLNDLLDLTKVEAGRLDLAFVPVALNDVVHECVALMQAQAGRERIIIRTALASELPPAFADSRSVRQILLNLLSNAIKFTGAGGQVILSTAITETGGIALRVRDTGIGMSESDIETALEPFRQLPAPTPTETVGTGLGLPLTKALAEANSAIFSIKSAINAGTLVEVVFRPAEPATR